jgi:hypothetical protein
MRKKGAIILATGGDNSNSAKGNFYVSSFVHCARCSQQPQHIMILSDLRPFPSQEGFMATGVASEATDAAIQANIVGVKYSGFSVPA